MFKTDAVGGTKTKHFNLVDLHHSYVCVGDGHLIEESIYSFLETECAIPVVGNPDVLLLEYDTLGIDDARFLRERQQHKAISGEKKFFIVSFTSITMEAQNSLLKIFEEPTEGTHFFIILDTIKKLLPTLLSRVQVEYFDTIDISEEAVRAFLESSSKERLDFLSDIIESKNKAESVRLCSGILQVLHRHIDREDVYTAIQNISFVLGYIHERGSSVKMIMEYMALSTPRFVL